MFDEDGAEQPTCAGKSESIVHTVGLARKMMMISSFDSERIPGMVVAKSYVVGATRRRHVL
jgi:hypothetical protein